MNQPNLKAERKTIKCTKKDCAGVVVVGGGGAVAFEWKGEQVEIALAPYAFSRIELSGTQALPSPEAERH